MNIDLIAKNRFEDTQKIAGEMAAIGKFLFGYEFEKTAFAENFKDKFEALYERSPDHVMAIAANGLFNTFGKPQRPLSETEYLSSLFYFIEAAAISGIQIPTLLKVHKAVLKRFEAQTTFALHFS